jgi:hypothetical protein
VDPELSVSTIAIDRAAAPDWAAAARAIDEIELGTVWIEDLRGLFAWEPWLAGVGELPGPRAVFVGLERLQAHLRAALGEVRSAVSAPFHPALLRIELPDEIVLVAGGATGFGEPGYLQRPLDELVASGVLAAAGFRAGPGLTDEPLDRRTDGLDGEAALRARAARALLHVRDAAAAHEGEGATGGVGEAMRALEDAPDAAVSEAIFGLAVRIFRAGAARGAGRAGIEAAMAALVDEALGALETMPPAVELADLPPDRHRGELLGRARSCGMLLERPPGPHRERGRGRPPTRDVIVIGGALICALVALAALHPEGIGRLRRRWSDAHPAAAADDREPSGSDPGLGAAPGPAMEVAFAVLPGEGDPDWPAARTAIAGLTWTPSASEPAWTHTATSLARWPAPLPLSAVREQLRADLARLRESYEAPGGRLFKVHRIGATRVALAGGTALDGWSLYWPLTRLRTTGILAAAGCRT